ncbi:hypothetical protein JK635_12150 [Neobacillus sp. YIM B02564]|uniref:PilZ domain-containing protein n=1 Tax=Neobacillus paridis TaxID=2803862 RepID=A0ABS1TST4_9BACI|nr:hypothetical protein [Neobacillus paridis]MBL4952965.1 hypothetical protein [Neobacillus paridis]
MRFSIENREFKRFVFRNPIHGFIEPTIPYNGKTKKNIWIVDMSAGGLKYVSDFEFGVNFIDMYQIQMTLENSELLLFGKIIRKKKLSNNLCEYSVKFDFDYHSN